MNKKAQKKATAPALVLESEEAFRGTLNRLLTLKLEVAAARVIHEEIIAKMKAQFEEDHQEELAQLAMLESTVNLYAVNYRDTLFTDGKKSREFENATVGFRDTPVSVGKLVSKDTFDVIALRVDAMPWGEPYVNWDVSLDKKALLRDRANLTPEQLRIAGISFEEGEQFYIEPNAKSLERTATPVSEIKEVA